MKLKNFKQQFILSGSDIDKCSELLGKALTSIGTERQNRIRLRLTLEELLLHYRDRFGESTPFQLSFVSRFGHSYIQIELEGDGYNPLTKVETELDEWSGSLLTSLGISPQYNYSGGQNIIRISAPDKRMNPVLRLLIALGIGVVGGVLLNVLLTEQSAVLLNNTLFEPIYNLWMRILNLVSGPVIFLMVATTILGFGRLTGKGANSKRLVGRYFLITLMIAVIVVGAAYFFSGIYVVSQEWDHTIISEFLDRLFMVVPPEIITPFMEANTPKLILLGFVFGAILVLIRDQVPTLVKLTKELNTVGLMVADWISWLVPVFTCILLILEIEGGSTMILLLMWEPLLIAVVVTAVLLGITLVTTALIKKVRIRVLLQKMARPFWITLKKGSLNDAYGQTEYSCTRLLGMDKEFTEISLSHGLVLYMPGSILGALIFTIWVASYYQISLSWLWLVGAILLVVILMEAAPPVPGVSLLVYIAVFEILGIPDEALIPAMVFDIVFSIVANAVNQMMLQLEMIHQADKFGLINRNTLRKSFK